MVEKAQGVLVLENAKTVVMMRNFAEGAVWVKDAGLLAHVRSGPITLQEKRVRPAQKTTDFSISGCRGSSIRGFCARVRWHWPRHLYSGSPWRRSADLQPSYHV